MLIVWGIVMTFLLYNYNKHYMETYDTSLQGFWEYMKEKYWTKKSRKESGLTGAAGLTALLGQIAKGSP